MSVNNTAPLWNANELQGNAVVNAVPTSDGDILVWNATNNNWEISSGLAALTVDKVTIKNTKRARFRLQPEANVNTDSNFMLTPQSAELNETSASISGQNITGFSGDLRFVLQPFILSSSQRINLFCNFFVNGVLSKVVAGPFYARQQNGHDTTGASVIFEYENANATDTFSFGLQREANSGTASLVSSGNEVSYVFVDEFSDLEVVTNASASINTSIAQGPAGPQGPQGPQGIQGPPANFSDIYHASGVVAGGGALLDGTGVASVSKLGTGRYLISYSNTHPETIYPVLLTLEQNPGDDDYLITYSNADQNQFEVQITEQDNGTTAGVFVDSTFSFYVSL